MDWGMRMMLEEDIRGCTEALRAGVVPGEDVAMDYVGYGRHSFWPVQPVARQAGGELVFRQVWSGQVFAVPVVGLTDAEVVRAKRVFEKESVTPSRARRFFCDGAAYFSSEAFKRELAACGQVLVCDGGRVVHGRDREPDVSGGD